MKSFFKKIGKTLWGKWMAFAKIVGLVNMNILLTLFFFLFLGPYGILLRLFGKKFSDRKFVDQPTYWIPKTHQDLKLDDYKRQF